mmetsp:Transcript_377/g.531  ORF Transcript_377/g.531 Transcript_377/m.531 type:complete len:275 (+) Transcript_377:103-927(+)
MAPSKLSQEERTKRKREAAKLRQRRCRAKKKIMESELKKDHLSTNKIKYATSSARNDSPSHAFEILSTVDPLRQESMTRRTRSRTKKTAILDLSSDVNECMSTPLRSDFSSMAVVTPLASDEIPKCDYGSMPQMPPLPNVTIDIQNRTPTSTPPARIDEEELNAIGAMLSLRHSPVADSCKNTTDKFPKSFKPRSSPDQSKGIFHAPLATSPSSPPLLPQIHAANKIPNILTNSRFMDPRPYSHSRAYLTKERGIKLMEKGRNLSPGVYFYYHH